MTNASAVDVFRTAQGTRLRGPKARSTRGSEGGLTVQAREGSSFIELQDGTRSVLQDVFRRTKGAPIWLGTIRKSAADRWRWKGGICWSWTTAIHEGTCPLSGTSRTRGEALQALGSRHFILIDRLQGRALATNRAVDNLLWWHKELQELAANDRSNGIGAGSEDTRQALRRVGQLQRALKSIDGITIKSVSGTPDSEPVDCPSVTHPSREQEIDDVLSPNAIQETYLAEQTGADGWFEDRGFASKGRWEVCKEHEQIWNLYLLDRDGSRAHIVTLIDLGSCKTWADTLADEAHEEALRLASASFLITNWNEAVGRAKRDDHTLGTACEVDPPSGADLREPLPAQGALHFEGGRTGYRLGNWTLTENPKGLTAERWRLERWLDFSGQAGSPSICTNLTVYTSCNVAIHWAGVHRKLDHIAAIKEDAARDTWVCSELTFTRTTTPSGTSRLEVWTCGRFEVHVDAQGADLWQNTASGQSFAAEKTFTHTGDAIRCALQAYHDSHRAALEVHDDVLKAELQIGKCVEAYTSRLEHLNARRDDAINR